MPLVTARIRQHLKAFDFRSLFIEELGWDRYNAQPLPVSVDDSTYSLLAQAEKRGMVIFVCQADGVRIPDYATRRKIEHRAAKTAYEHIIIYTDVAKTSQIWQWVRREKGRPTACREHTFHKGQSGDGLVQRLRMLAFSLEEEDSTTLTRVTGRARQAFDVDRITKRFYERFKREHTAFLAFIKGIQVDTDREWYASLMLNRLMFVYFIQKKGFLDGEIHYLRNRLQLIQQRRGKDRFLSFYRYFLLKLFHEGLGHPIHSQELAALLGKVPYLNGGLFEVHDLENNYPNIDIPDEAFEKIFDFFDAYHWHLDDRPLRADNEINPDVLGYIFEKYINQKQMGAYYTKEDITEYISKSTILPFLFEAAEKKCSIAFKPDGAVWRLLRDEPDRYIYEAVRKGVDLDLPAEIAAGLNDVSKRGGWNRPAAAAFGLPTETWREHVARRQRCLELRQKLAAGEVHNVNDLITLNLDIRTFAEDVVWNCEGPELLRAIYSTVAGRIPEKSNEKFEPGMSILDPTCGSGAFLFAALNILEPLYQACLARMESIVEDHDRAHPGQVAKFADFRKILERVDQHPNQRYFVLKSIILGNLYGVDIMEEAVEICKLRLFLKLVAEVEPDSSKANLGLEPLPDIDFNIRAGNTLVGFANEESLKRHFSEAGHGQQRMLSTEESALITRIDESAEIAGRAYERFREMQTKHEMAADQFLEAKKELRRRLKELGNELDRYLAADYEINRPRFKNTTEWDTAVAHWRTSHQPFHWLIEFYGIMRSGGFDVIIGNPPYVELTAVTQYRAISYQCTGAGNLYALVMERSCGIAAPRGYVGFIVPVSSVSTDRYESLQAILRSKRLHYSSYDDRPSRLFDGLEHIRLTIHIIKNGESDTSNHSTRYNKWTSVERTELFKTLGYANVPLTLVECSMPKFSSEFERGIGSKLSEERSRLALFYRRSQHHIYYSRKVGYFVQVLDFEPSVLDGRGRRRPPSEFKLLAFHSEAQAKIALCALNSNLFYWFVTVYSDCRHVNKREVDSFPIDLPRIESSQEGPEFVVLARDLMAQFKANSIERVMSFSHDRLTVQCIFPKQSKPLIDRIDSLLARHYGFTDDELDFIINYDIKYRMGQDTEDVEDE